MELFNNNWQFKMENEETWQDIQIPHDWMISDTKNLYKDGIGCYRKIFTQQKPKPSEKLYLRFDGVYMDSTLHVNGKEVGQWKNGYTDFHYNIAPYINEGENEILLTADYKSPNTRWYSGAGIYRDCWLIKKNPTHFKLDGIYITTKKTNNGWQLEINSEVESPDSYEIRHTINGLEFNEISPNTFMATNPKIWDTEHPHCYTLESTLLVNGQVTDTARTRFGFREIEYTTDKGFFLNGKHTPLKGVCQHHDLGALGSAVHKDALRRQLQALKAMGVNAIRTAHNPPAEVFMELVDEMGFLIMTELTDIWKRSKTKYDYARFFEEWAARDVASWVRRDRNCPSIIMWSVGNEIYDTHADFESGSATMRFLMDEVKKHHPNSDAPSTLCSNYLLWESTQKCADIIKFIGYNYADNLYQDHHNQHPDWIIYGGETASVVQSRSIYHFPLKKALLADDDLQCSDLGNSATSWGAKSAEACIINHRNAPYTLGQFIWTGTDYIGEPTPYHTKNSYFGQIDTAGFPKDAFYIYKSAWTSYKTDPFIHLFPYWDWSPGQVVDVRIASNCPKVELFLNGKSMGKQTIDHENGNTLIANYNLEYETGEIKAIAYDENDKIITETTRKSFTDATTLKLTNTEIGELIFTEITALDATGNTVENANNRVKVTVKNGKLLGLDNGDSTDYDQYQNNDNRRLFSGKLLAIIKPDSKNIEITAEIDPSDIPIRKIELIRTNNTVKAKIHPQNATYKDISWRLADEAGIDSYLGRLEVHENRQEATLQPKGDGEVYIRASTKNGKDHVNLISLLPITITGYGKPFLDPYSFISGGLYNRSNVPMTNGNERGVATPRDGESHVGFADLDFGSFGSDEVTLWLFPFGNNFPIELWQGMPGEGKKLTTVTYDKGSIWNTYIPVTYKLPERLKGVQTFSLVVNLKVHIKGFQFAAQSKGYEKLNFTSHDHIYGDSFTLKENSVEKIGNNVTITFNHMDFTNTANEIEISWRTTQDTSMIKLVFTDENGIETPNMLTLTAQENYATTSIKLDTPLTGKGDINFIFLPGSNIDLEWFQFKGDF